MTGCAGPAFEKEDINVNSKEHDRSIAASIVMGEFDALRSQIIYALGARHMIVSALVTVITALVGVVIYYNSHFGLLLLAPVVATIFGYMWAVEEESIPHLASYIRHEIEEGKVPALCGYTLDPEPDTTPRYRKLWMAWESYNGYMRRQENEMEVKYLDRVFRKYGWALCHYLIFVGSSLGCIVVYVCEQIWVHGARVSIIDACVPIDIVLLIFLFLRLRKAETVSYTIESQLAKVETGGVSVSRAA